MVDPGVPAADDHPVRSVLLRDEPHAGRRPWWRDELRQIKAKQLSKDMPKTTFADVAGADEAVEELDDQGLPAEPGPLPGARRQDP